MTTPPQRTITPVKHLKYGDVIADLRRGIIVVERVETLSNGDVRVDYRVKFHGEPGYMTYTPNSEVLVIK